MRYYIELTLFGILSLPCSAVLADSLEAERNAQETQCSAQINYMSDTDSAYKYLEEEQRKIYQENPDVVDRFAREELSNPRSVRSFAELKKRALKACPDKSKRDTCALDPDMVDRLISKLPCLSLPTRFESPLFFSLINLYSKQLEILRTSRFPASSTPRFGSLPTGTIDAQAIFPPGTDAPLIILNRDLFFFTGALSKSISDAIPISEGDAVRIDYSEEGIRKRLRDHPYIVVNFADAISRIVRGGSSSGAREITLDEAHNHLHARLVTAMDMFVISHEEAHVILGHVSNEFIAFHLAGINGAGKNQSNRIPESQESKDKGKAQYGTHHANIAADTLMAQVRTRTQELEADTLGFKLLMWDKKNGNDPIGQMIAAAAPHVVFRIMDAVDAYSREAGGWVFGDINHPVAEDRIATLAHVLDELTKENDLLRQADFRIPFDEALRVLLVEADSLIRQNLGLALKPSS